jgi:hypothetical protein
MYVQYKCNFIRERLKIKGISLAAMFSSIDTLLFDNVTFERLK